MTTLNNDLKQHFNSLTTETCNWRYYKHFGRSTVWGTMLSLKNINTTSILFHLARFGETEEMFIEGFPEMVRNNQDYDHFRKLISAKLADLRDKKLIHDYYNLTDLGRQIGQAACVELPFSEQIKKIYPLTCQILQTQFQIIYGFILSNYWGISADDLINTSKRDIAAVLTSIEYMLADTAAYNEIEQILSDSMVLYSHFHRATRGEAMVSFIDEVFLKLNLDRIKHYG